MVVFFQAEDGIRDRTVTGVQTCALPIWAVGGGRGVDADASDEIRMLPLDGVGGGGQDASVFHVYSAVVVQIVHPTSVEIGRASCRESVEVSAGGVTVESKFIELHVYKWR